MVFRRIKVIYAALLFAAIETVIVMFDVQDSTAHFAHIGGLISGVALAALLIKNRGFKELDSKPKPETIYYDSYSPQKPKKINFSNLRKLAETQKQKEMLKRIEHETVPQVRDVWLEHFLEQTKCPKCGKTLNHFDNKVWCEECGFKTNY